jgi:hypothetical protein
LLLGGRPLLRAGGADPPGQSWQVRETAEHKAPVWAADRGRSYDCLLSVD